MQMTFPPSLVLNADFQPLSYFPLSLWSWRDAVKAAMADRVMVLSEYDLRIRSPSISIALPSVIALKDYVRFREFPPFTRFNLFLRDAFTCQYCGIQGSAEHLTFDHVIPRRQGGKTTWRNVVAACSACNFRKGGHSPTEARMPLRNSPIRPTYWTLQKQGRRFPPQSLHKSWYDFLYWDSELEE